MAGPWSRAGTATATEVAPAGERVRSGAIPATVVDERTVEQSSVVFTAAGATEIKKVAEAQGARIALPVKCRAAGEAASSRRHARKLRAVAGVKAKTWFE